MKVHFIQQDSWVLPGEYLAWAERHGYDVAVTKCWEYETVPESAEADLLVVLGGCQCPATTKEECCYFDKVCSRKTTETSVTCQSGGCFFAAVLLMTMSTRTPAAVAPPLPTP